MELLNFSSEFIVISARNLLVPALHKTKTTGGGIKGTCTSVSKKLHLKKLRDSDWETDRPVEIKNTCKTKATFTDNQIA